MYETLRMREITWSVKGTLNVLLQSFSPTSIYICTAHALKRLLMNFRYKFRHRRSIRRPRFPVRVQNFGHLATFCVDFCILYYECPPYFYFRFVSPTCLTYWPRKYTTRVDPHVIIPTKFEVDMTIHEVQRFCLLIRHVTWWPWPFGKVGHVTRPTLPPSTKTLRLSVLELRVITFPIGYHWKCVRGHCACAESRDP